MNILRILAAIAVIAIVAASCSDDKGTDNSIADSYTGIWNAKDTTDYFGSLSYSSYNFSIAKRTDNSVFFINFKGEDTTIFTVTETALSYVSGAENSEYLFTTLVATKSGNRIMYTGDDYGGLLRGVATRQ